MSVEEFIASGILEAYLLGELPEEEMAKVEQMASKHPTVKAEIEAIEQALETMAQKTGIVPPASLKNRLFQSIGEVGPMKPQGEVPRLRANKRSGRNKMTYLVAASIALSIITSGAALTFWNKWRDAEDRVSDLLVQNQVLAEDYSTASQKLEQTTQDLSILTGKDYHKVVMTATTSSESSASVYWSQQDQQVFLSIGTLPVPPPDKQYQLWALVDGQPIDAGIFDLPTDANSLLQMKSMEAADAFAITLEPVGGSPAPTLEDLQVIGNV